MDSYGVDKGALSLDSFFVFLIKTIKINEDDLVNFFFMNFSLAVDKCYSYLRYYVPHWIILVI